MWTGSPAGWYSHSQSAPWSFSRFWRRSLPRHIGLELCLYIVLYYAVHLASRLLLSTDQKVVFEAMVSYFNTNLSPLSKELTFLLGFYVKQVIGI